MECAENVKTEYLVFYSLKPLSQTPQQGQVPVAY